MNFKDRFETWLTKHKLGRCCLSNRVLFLAVCSLVLNLLFALLHLMLGIANQSAYFYAMFVFYVLLAGMRFVCVLLRKEEREKDIAILTGCMLLVLALVLSLTHFLSLSQNMVSKHGTILMITVAAYTFLKLGLAIHRVVKAKRQPSLRFSSIRTIGYAEVAAAVLTLQRSMLVSFDEMDVQKASALNAATGALVFAFILFLGILLLIKAIKKSKEKPNEINPDIRDLQD